MSRFVAILLAIFSVLPIIVTAETPALSPPADSKTGTTPAAADYLKPVQTFDVPSVASGLFGLMKCDGDGNLYLAIPHERTAEIHKLNAKGEGLLLVPDTDPEMKMDAFGSFAVGRNGELYEIAFPHDITRQVLVYKSDGKYKSAIKLQLGFEWLPSALAVFPSGDLLISGLRWRGNDKPRSPFTGIFSPDGMLVKEVKLEDDDALWEMAANGDSRVVSPRNRWGNLAVSSSQMETAADGNIYLMRWTSPAIFYAISPAGEVVRRFTVDPGDSFLSPSQMHISGKRIAVLFFQRESKEERMMVVDLEGREVGAYSGIRAAGKTNPGMLLFACYAADPERFTFISPKEDDKLQLLIAQPH